MKCPKCQYELTEGERLLCSVPGGHYCPRCWTRIPEPVDKTRKPADSGSGTTDADRKNIQNTGRQV
jgi:hypothetical protein